ncbi:phage tail length tape measure family protein [Mesorhizobium sp. Pch-S]|uniref:phage tail length tape measure family protein n=1 Tax=Mesorhizobium sp. Pch-S TaxID=2082387 RepID=UPI0010103440|nr:phage tail length tape measure family protein [Mesorhizobium sp. Pch-S]QAZ45959.1 hypothetical protein C1M53_26615 [Mesorhizobium sp. Pch-S]
MPIADLGISVRSGEVKQATGDLDRLTSSSTKADAAIERLGRSSATANADFGRVSAGVEQANAALTRLVALGEQSNAALSRIASGSVVARDGLRQVAREADNTITRVRAMNDNMAQFRRQNLTYQLFDVGQMAALGQNPAMTLMQQGPQIAQLYAGQGGVNAALRDAGTLAGGLITKLWPVGIAAAAGGLAIRGLQSDIEKATGKTIEFGDAAAGAFRAIKEDITAQLKPVIDDVSPWFSAAWDTVGGGAVTAAETIINSFHAAYVDVEYLWSQFPNMMGSLVTKGLNAMVGGIQTMIQTGATYIDAFLEKINAALEKADALFPGGGYRLGTIGKIDFGPPLPDPYSDSLSKATEERNRRVNEIMTSTPLRDYYRTLRDRVGGDLHFNLPTGGTGSPIPLPNFRGVDDIPGDQEYLQDFQKKNEVRIRQLEDQKNALGLTGAALEAFRVQQEAVNSALSANIELTPEQLELIKKQAAAYGEMAEALAKAKLAKDLAFERDQLGRSDVEQAVAATLKQYGLGEDLNGPEAAIIRSNELLKKQVDLWKDVRKGGMDAYSDIFDLAFDGFDNWQERLSDIAKDMAKNIFDLSVKNPFLNEQYGANLPTMNQTGGIGGFFATMLGMTPNPAINALGTQSVGAMTVNAASVVVMGSIGVGGADGVLNRVFSPANSNGLKASDYAPMSLSGIGSPGSLGSNAPYNVANATSFIKQYASAIGIDPDIALKVARSEGLGAGIWQSNYSKGGFREPSFGPFQLLKGGQGTGFGTGLGNRFMQQTGLDPADPANWQKSTAFALDQAKAGGWGPWYGAKNQGITGFMGIDRSAEKATAALDNLSTGTVDAGKGLNAFGGGMGKLGNALSQFPGAPGGGGGGFLGGLGKMLGGGLNSLFSGTKAFSWLSANPGGSIGLFADGTENAPAGWAWVGEEGPELRKLRAGDVIRSNPRSMEMMANARGIGPSKTEMHFHNAPPVLHQQEEDDGEGGKRMDIWFEQQTAKATSRRGSAANKALASMGLTRPMKVR